MKPLEHPHWLPWAPQIQVHWGPCRSLLSWVTLNRELLASSCKFIFIISEKRINGQTLCICLEKRKTLKKKELGGRGKGLHFYRFWMFHVIPLGYGHYTETNPSISWSTPAASCRVSWQHWNPRLITPCMPNPGFSALERGGWLLVSEGWEMALCQHVSALGACSHSCTSQISESRGGSFLSCSRRANTCSEWTLLSVRRLTSFINIRGNIKRSFGLLMQM